MAGVSLEEAIGRPMTGVARISLQHWRCSIFRPIAILEYAALFLCMICMIPLLLFALWFTNGEVDVPNIRLKRFYKRWHQIRLVLLDAKGQTLSVVDHRPETEEQGHVNVASILSAAAREQVVVVESIIDREQSEVAEVWYGGRPLLAHPDEVNEERATILLEQHGVVVQREANRLSIIEEALPVPTERKILGWLLLPLVLPFVPLLWLSENGRRGLRHGWEDLRGRGVRTRAVVEVRAESISFHRERGNERWDHEIVDGADLIGITVSPLLGYDQDVTKRPASLRLIGKRHSRGLPLERARKAEHALRDLLVAATLRLREARPELGLLGAGPQPTRCPFCAARYMMEPGARCPSCGAHAGQTP
jgi:hypothetical protein